MGSLLRHVEETLDANCERHGAFTDKRLTMGERSYWQGCPACFLERRRGEEKDREAVLLQRRKEAINTSLVMGASIPPRFQHHSLDTYRTSSKEQAGVLQLARNYAADFAAVRESGRSLILCGPPGTGKTHLSCGIASEVMRQGYSALFVTATGLVRRVYETYGKGSAETTRAVLHAFSKVDLLIIDEVGNQFGSHGEKVTLTEALGARYEQNAPTIVLSNLDIAGISEALGDRVIDRLRQNGGRAIVCDWESYRRGGW